MTAQRKPAEVFTLAEYLCDEFVARGWKTVDAARRFDNGSPHHLNLLALNLLMLGYRGNPAPKLVIGGLANALGVSQTFLRSIEKPAFDYPDRVAPWLCPLDVLSQEMKDYLA